MASQHISEKVILSAQVAATQRDRLADLAATNERSLSGELRRAVAIYLRLAEPPESFSTVELPPSAGGSGSPPADGDGAKP
jgi:hypothetical protein